MKVSEVRLTLINSETAFKAIGSFTLDEAFVVKGVRVVENKNGQNFVSFPSREKQDGTYEDVAFPLSKELYAEITGAVLNEYQKLSETKVQEQAPEPEPTPAKKPRKPKSR